MFEFQTYPAASQFADFPSVVLRFQSSLDPTQAKRLDAIYRRVFNSSSTLWHSKHNDDDVPFVNLVVAIARNIYAPQLYKDKKILEHGTGEAGNCWVALRYVNIRAAKHALTSAFELASRIISVSNGNSVPGTESEVDVIGKMRQQVASMLPHPNMQMLMASASSRGIPVYATGPSGRVWQFGQGSNSRHVAPFRNDGDSMTGQLLTLNKMQSNQLVANLGFPDQNKARIPVVLLVDTGESAALLLVAEIERGDCPVGLATSMLTLIDGAQRGMATDGLTERVHSLVIDPLCQVLLISCGMSELQQYGLPIDYFDIVVAQGQLPVSLEGMVKANCGAFLVEMSDNYELILSRVQRC